MGGNDKIRQLLVATDFSERSNRAVRRAGLLARELDAHLMLLHVVDDDRPERLVAAETAAAQELLDASIATVLRDVKCEAKMVRGAPADGVAKVAAASAADLIVMGAHRKQILRDIFVGTSIERVARQRVAPVLMVNTEPVGPYRQSLIGVDLSEHSGHALQTARSLGVLSQSQVIIVHAFEAFAKGKMNYAGVSREAIAAHVAHCAKEARAELTSFLNALGDELGPYFVRINEGRAADVITEVANAEHADIVVMATHGRSGVLKLLLGSVTEEIMERLDRDILVVPPAPPKYE